MSHALTPEQIEKLQLPTHLKELTGSRNEVLAQKTAIIRKFGYAAWEQLCIRSSQSAK